LIDLLRVVRELAISVLLGAILFVGVNSVTARCYVDQISMEPNLHAGQVLLVNRLGISGFSERVYAATQPTGETESLGWVPARGSICTFLKPDDPSTTLVKRLIGLPGEEIEIRDGVVFINGQRLDEPYVVNHDQSSMEPLVIPADSVFMMGDNRPHSGDSRMFGPVPRANLLGVAVARYWPLQNFTIFFAR
jgi:signal peptidase I